MDINFMTGLMSKVNAKINAAKSVRQEEETAGNYDHRQDEGVSSRVLTEVEKKKRDETASEKVSKRKRKDKKGRAKGAQSPIEEEMIEEGALFPNKSEGEQLPDQQQLGSLFRKILPDQLVFFLLKS